MPGWRRRVAQLASGRWEELFCLAQLRVGSRLRIPPCWTRPAAAWPARPGAAPGWPRPRAPGRRTAGAGSRRPGGRGPGGRAGRRRRRADNSADLLVADPDLADGPALPRVAALLDLEPVAVVGTTGSTGWAVALGQVRDGLRMARGHLGDTEGLLVALEDTRLAGLAGLLARTGNSAPVAGAARQWRRLRRGGPARGAARPGRVRLVRGRLLPRRPGRPPGPRRPGPGAAAGPAAPGAGGAALALGVLLGGLDLLGG